MKVSLIGLALLAVVSCGPPKPVTGAKSGAQMLAEEIAVAKRAGMPLTLAELYPERPIASEKNAALIYKSFSAKVRSTRDPRFQFVSECLNPGAFSDAQANIREIEKDWRADLAQLRQATKLPNCDYGLKHDLGIVESGFDGPGQAKEITKLLCACAIVAAADGRLSDTRLNFLAAFGLSQHLYQTPGLISNLTAKANELILLGAIRNLAAYDSGNLKVLSMLEEVLDGDWKYPSLRRAWEGEILEGKNVIPLIKTRANLVEFIKDTEAEGINVPLQLPRDLKDLRDRWEAEHYRYMRLLWESAPADPEDFLEGCRKVQVISREVEGRKDLGAAINKIHDVVNSHMPVSFGNAVTSRRLETAYVQILSFRVRHGRLPKQLTELPNTPIDPFNNKPFSYIVTGDTFVLKAVGAQEVFGDTYSASKPLKFPMYDLLRDIAARQKLSRP